MKLGYYKELDGVRAIAALMVMFFHFFPTPLTPDPLLISIKKMAVFGQTGVSLFFVLSGFLITRILIAAKEDKHYFLNFYMRRSLRIFPLYFLFLALWYFVLPIIEKVPITDFKLQVYYWIYMQDFAATFNWPSLGPGHFWSLAVEEHFYLFWPFVIYFLNKRQIVIASIAVILISLIVRVVLVKNHYEVFYLTFSRMDELAVGALLAILEINKKLTNQHSKKFLFAFALVIIPTIGLWVNNNSSGNSSLQVFKFILLSLGYFCLIGYVITIKNTSIVKKFFSSSILNFTGKISYGLYVYHPVCFLLYNKFLGQQSLLLNFFGSFLAAYIMATISFYSFESYFLNFKKRFSK